MSYQEPTAFQSDSSSYTAQHLIGKGGFGRVYEVRDEHGRHYALKIVDLSKQMPEERVEIVDKFRLEYEITKKLDHPNIVQSHDFGEDQGNPFMVMDLCVGGNLYDMFSSVWEYEDLETTIREVLYGLRHAHKQGIVHRDLKPENILFSQEGVAMIADFGIAADVRNRRTRRDWRGYVSEVFATIPYSPPEQTDRRSAYHVYATNDIFALGVIIYELITKGQYPFGSEAIFEKDMGITYQKRKEQGLWDQETLAEFEPPERWAKIIETCIQPNIEDRYQTSNDLLMVLGEDIVESESDDHAAIFEKGPWHLTIQMGDQVGRVYHLSSLSQHLNKRRLSLGWYDSENPYVNDIGIMETYTQYISRRHATLELSYPTQNMEHWRIRDGQAYNKNGIPGWYLSKNGVYLNGKRIDKQGAVIRNGDILTIGDFTFKVEVG